MAVNWTPELNEEFRKLRPIKPVRFLASYFGTTVAAIRAHSLVLDIKLLDRKPWSDCEVVQLAEMDDAKMSIAAMSRALGRPAGSVQWKLEDIGRKSDRRPSWDKLDDEISQTAENAGRPLTGAEVAALAAKIDRPVDSVRQRVVKLGFEIEPRARPWNAEHLAALHEMAGGASTLREAAARLGRSLGSVRGMADRLGLVFAVRPVDDHLKAVVGELESVAKAESADSIRSIAKKLELDPRRLKKLAADAGIALPVRKRAKPAEVTKEQLESLVEQGNTLSSAAKLLSRDYRTLRALAEKFDVVFPAYVPKPAIKSTEKRVRKLAASKPRLSSNSAQPGSRREPGHIYRPAPVVIKHVHISPDPVLRPVETAKPPARPSFGRLGLSAPVVHEIIDQSSVDEAVRRFIATRGVTKIELSPVEEAVNTIRKLGFSVVARGSGWVLDDRIEIDSANQLIDFARIRVSRHASLTMTAT